MTATTPRDAFTPTTRAMYDLLCDGAARSIDEVVAAGIHAALGSDYNRCVEEGRRKRRVDGLPLRDYAWSGAKSIARNNLTIAARGGRVTVDADLVTMDAAFAADWSAAKRAAARPQRREPVTVQPFGAVTHYAGLPEWEGWAFAPLEARDVAHVRTTRPVELARLRAAFPGWEVKEAPDGLISVYAHPGAPVKAVVTDWLTDNGIHHEGVRDARGVKRRDLTQLPAKFLRDLMAKTVPFARGLIGARHGGSMQRLVGDYDDIDGYVTLWVLELAQSFDASLGRPFGTWVTNQLPRKVQDLNRASHGRTASDVEIAYAKAVAEFQNEHGVAPTNEEIRIRMGLSRAEWSAKRAHLSTLAGLRTPGHLDHGPDDSDIQVVDERMTPEQQTEIDERAQQVTLALFAATGTNSLEDGVTRLTRPLGFFATYMLMWDEWVKGDIITLAGCADRRVSEELGQVNTDLADLLADLRHAA